MYNKYKYINSTSQNVKANPFYSPPFPFLFSFCFFLMANSNSHSKQLISEESRETSIKYRECWRNHAVLLGGYAADGCREFTPKGDQGTKEALLCEACDCHRNFHRKEIIKNGSTLVGSHHFHPPYGVCYPMWGMRNVLGFYPLPHLYRQLWHMNNEQSLASDEESVIYNESQREMQINASKRPKREPL